MTAVDDHTLSSAVEQPHAAALAALDDPEAGALRAVTWSSAHLAAVGRVVYPAARKALPDGPSRVRALLEVDRRLQQALWRLDRHMTGDVHLSHLPEEVLLDRVREWLERHDELERPLVADLAAAVGEQREKELVAKLAAVMPHAPTRPHPDTPRFLVLSTLAFKIDALADHLRDVMDNRHIPTPRLIKPALKPGLWGSYLMGATFRDEPREKREPAAEEPAQVNR